MTENYCQRCGSEDALNVTSVRMDYERLNLCEFCRTIPGGIIRHGDGIAYSIVGNILARLIKEAE